MAERRLVNHPNQQCECHWCGKSLDKEIKQARAEVLAACLARLGDLVVSRQDAATQAGKDDKETLLDERDGLRAAIRALKELQPAASALGALLREARKEGRQQEQKGTLFDVLAFNSGLGCTPQEGYRDLADALRDTKHLSAELEKARASEREESTGS